MTADYPGVDSKISFYDFRISEEHPQSVYQALNRAASEKVHVIYLSINEKLEFHLFDAIQRLNKEQKFVDKKSGNEILITASACSPSSQNLFTVSLLGLLPNVFMVGSMSVAHSNFHSVIYFEDGENTFYRVKYLTRKVFFRTNPAALKVAAIFPDDSFSGSLTDEKLVFFFCETMNDCSNVLEKLEGKFTSAIIFVSKEDLSELRTKIFENEVPIGFLTKIDYDSLFLKLKNVEKIEIYLENRKTDPLHLEKPYFYPSSFRANGPNAKLHIKPDFLVSSYRLKENENKFSKLYSLYEPPAISNARFASVLAAYANSRLQRGEKIRYLDVLQFAQGTAKPLILSGNEHEIPGLPKGIAQNYVGWATPVMWQGAGMLNAEELLKISSVKLSTGKLELGDFSSEKVKEVVIQNDSEHDIYYELEHIPALTYHQSKELNSQPNFETMSIQLKWKKTWIPLFRSLGHKSKEVQSNYIQVGKESKVNITLKFSAPKNAKSFTFFNGYIRFKPVLGLESNYEYVSHQNGNDHPKLHLPFFGIYKGFHSFPYIQTMSEIDKSQFLAIDDGSVYEPVIFENSGDINPQIKFELTLPLKKLQLFLKADGKEDRTIPTLAEYNYLQPGVYSFPSKSKEAVQSARGYECGWTGILNPGNLKESLIMGKSRTNAKYQLCIRAKFWEPIEVQRLFKEKVGHFFKKSKGINNYDPQVFCSQSFQISECSKEN